MSALRLGLIGDNIVASRAPDLHRICGKLAGVDLTYERLIPAVMGMSFDAVFDHAVAEGFAGVNVTLPYKERVLARLTDLDPVIAGLGAVNTVRFGLDGTRGFNTDYSGFVAAYRAQFGEALPGRVVMIGAGGVGKAVAFGLGALGAAGIIVADKNAATAVSLVAALTGAGVTGARIGDLDDLDGADGVINCTPLGMHGYPGSPVPEGAFPANGWAFDAVYTPAETPFRAQALAAGAAFLPGYELFFHQGIQAFEIFTGKAVPDQAKLRERLAAG